MEIPVQAAIASTSGIISGQVRRSKPVRCRDCECHTSTTLGAYSVTAKIGEGRMGEVYRARDGDRWLVTGGKPSTGRSVPLGR